MKKKLGSKLIENFQLLDKECYFQNLLYYIKSNIIRAPLEMLSVLYLAALGVIFTTLVFRKSLESSQIVYMIFSPLAFSAVICISYSIIAAFIIFKWAYKAQLNITEKCGDEQPTETKLEEIYFSVDESFSEIMYWLHFGGILFYLAGSIFIAEYLPKMHIMFGNDSFRKYLILFGLFSGIAWNIYGYQSDKRLDWSKIFKRLETINISTNKNIHGQKLHFYLRSIIMQLSCCLALSIFAVICLIKINPNLFSEIKTGDLASCSAFLTLLVSVITLYVRTSYTMFFSRKYRDSVIFPNWRDFFPEKDKRKKTQRLRHLRHPYPNTPQAAPPYSRLHRCSCSRLEHYSRHRPQSAQEYHCKTASASQGTAEPR